MLERNNLVLDRGGVKSAVKICLLSVPVALSKVCAPFAKVRFTYYVRVTLGTSSPSLPCKGIHCVLLEGNPKSSRRRTGLRMPSDVCNVSDFFSFWAMHSRRSSEVSLVTERMLPRRARKSIGPCRAGPCSANLSRVCRRCERTTSRQQCMKHPQSAQQ